MHPPSHGIKSWFHAPTFTATHCIIDPETRHCAILDSVLDFDYASGRTSTALADRIAAFVRAGEMPKAESNGVSYLKFPVNQL